MGKKVKVVTKCGDEHIYNFNQEVDTVEIVEKTPNLDIIRQENLKGKGHWHLVNKCGYQVGNIYTDGSEILIYYHRYDGVSVKLVDMVENWT